MKSKQSNLKIVRRRATGLSSEAGLTLVEIIVVLIILGTLFAVIGGNLFKNADRAKANLNKIAMDKLKGAINQFQLQYNKLPSTLGALVNGETGLAGFVPIADQESLLDPWGGQYRYQKINNRSYRITSLGADGVDGGEGADADIHITGP